MWHGVAENFLLYVCAGYGGVARDKQRDWYTTIGSVMHLFMATTEWIKWYLLLTTFENVAFKNTRIKNTKQMRVLFSVKQKKSVTETNVHLFNN